MLRQLDGSLLVSIDFDSWLGALLLTNYQPIETSQSNCFKIVNDGTGTANQNINAWIRNISQVVSSIDIESV